MNIHLATNDDIDILCLYDRHISREELKNSINLDRIFIAEKDKKFIGWLRYNLFWDNIPFMNLLYILENYQNKGYGKALTEYWEAKMKALGYDMVLTSSQQNEFAQHFYVKLGYKAIGGFNLNDDPMEIIFAKNI